MQSSGINVFNYVLGLHSHILKMNVYFCELCNGCQHSSQPIVSHRKYSYICDPSDITTGLVGYDRSFRLQVAGALKSSLGPSRNIPFPHLTMLLWGILGFWASCVATSIGFVLDTWGQQQWQKNGIFWFPIYGSHFLHSWNSLLQHFLLQVVWGKMDKIWVRYTTNVDALFWIMEFARNFANSNKWSNKDFKHSGTTILVWSTWNVSRFFLILWDVASFPLTSSSVKSAVWATHQLFILASNWKSNTKEPPSFIQA